MKRAIKKGATLLLTAALLLTIGCGPAKETPNQTKPFEKVENQPAGATPVAGKPAPDFTLKTMSGEEITLSKLKGKKVILNFWASWCDPCRTEMPDFKEVARAHEGLVDLYGINLTDEDEPELAKKMILDLGLTFKNLFDEGGIVQKNYRILSVPTTIVIDEQGVILQRIDGQLNRGQIENIFQGLAKNPSK
jgi:peroxiredoxin